MMGISHEMTIPGFRTIDDTQMDIWGGGVGEVILRSLTHIVRIIESRVIAG